MLLIVVSPTMTALFLSQIAHNILVRLSDLDEGFSMGGEEEGWN